MRTTRVVALASILLTAMLSLFGACAPATESPVSEESPAAESNRWLELLSVLPANENTLKGAYLQDLALLEEKTDQFSSLRYPVTINMPLFGSGPNDYSDEEWQRTLGFTQGDVEQTVYVPVPPPRLYQAVRGRFSQDDIDSAVHAGPMNEMLEVVSHGGREYYRWGEDFGINVTMRSGVRPLGRGHRLALVDGFIFWILWTDGIQEMIDAHDGTAESLADIEDYRLLAGALAEMDTVTAFLSSESQSQSRVQEVYEDIIDDPANNERRQTLVEEIQRPLLLKPYQAMATGAGIDDKGYFMAIVLMNPSEVVARDNTALLEERLGEAKNVAAMREWSGLIESMEIEVDGRLTLARLYGEACIYWSSFQVTGERPYEPLLLHE
jgi:hypothetical protein